MTETSMESMISDLESASGRLLVINADSRQTKATEWADKYARKVDDLVQSNGAILIRGLRIHSSMQFGQTLQILFGEELLSYTYRSTPRIELRGNIFTATEYPASETIPQHNENAYSNRWPMRLGFLCMVPPEQGGETPLADSRVVYNSISPEIREKFERKKIMYVRNYGDIDLPWTEVFQTRDKSKVEAYCRHNQLEFAWLGDNSLRTTQVNRAIARHPVTKEKIWFNQAHLFHVSNLDKETMKSFLSIYDESQLPRNSYYGDGTPLETDVLQAIRDAYDNATFSFPWQKSDLILLDNMLFTHGRRPFRGERKVLVGMAREYGWQHLSQDDSCLDGSACDAQAESTGPV